MVILISFSLPSYREVFADLSLGLATDPDLADKAQVVCYCGSLVAQGSCPCAVSEQSARGAVPKASGKDSFNTLENICARGCYNISIVILFGETCVVIGTDGCCQTPSGYSMIWLDVWLHFLIMLLVAPQWRASNEVHVGIWILTARSGSPVTTLTMLIGKMRHFWGR